MGDPTLARGATNFNTSASTTLTFYNVSSEEFKKSTNLITLPLPASDSSSNIAFDLLGVSRDITVRGRFVATTDPLTVAKFTADLDSLARGTQGDTGSGQVGFYYTPVGFTPTTAGYGVAYLRVFISDVNWTYAAGDPMSVEYNVTMTEISSSSA